jgi:hypothetical protein
MSQNRNRKWSDMAEPKLERVHIFVKNQNRHHWWLNLSESTLEIANWPERDRFVICTGIGQNLPE